MVKNRSRDQGKFLIRFSEQTRKDLDRAVAGSGRTMTAEIVARLGWSFEEERRSSEGAASFREYAARDALSQAEAAIGVLEKELAELKAKIVATKSQLAASRLLKL
ncbi:hypothetical protein [Hyphomicrobium sp. 99]|uniref:hypothetical protein n=1 Tax=Hyphomicrobium sp. 99 TaxID=1163419 RepID=UPI0018CF756B|nr:hypothetical protein [Hyphomicrobium sp. 99]